MEEEGRGWKRKKEEGGGWKEEAGGGRRKQGRQEETGEAEEDRKARLALRFGRRVRGDDDGAEEGADGAGRGPQVMMVEAG